MVIGSDAGKASGRFIFTGNRKIFKRAQAGLSVVGLESRRPRSQPEHRHHRTAGLGRGGAVSSFYETEPVELTAQPWFLNCAIKLDTEKMPKQLMSGILDLEKEMGRRRQQNKGPRIIDIDILLFGSSIIETKGLTIPHPAMHQRRFVLEPLAEIASEVRHPVFKRTVRELRDALPPGQAVRRIQASGLGSQV